MAPTPVTQNTACTLAWLSDLRPAPMRNNDNNEKKNDNNKKNLFKGRL